MLERGVREDLWEEGGDYARSGERRVRRRIEVARRQRQVILTLGSVIT